MDAPRAARGWSRAPRCRRAGCTRCRDFRHSAAASVVTFGPRLVDHRDDAERDANARDREAVGPRICSRSTRPSSAGCAAISRTAADSLAMRAPSSISRSRIAPAGPRIRRRQIACVRGEDLGRVPIDRIGDREQRAVRRASGTFARVLDAARAAWATLRILVCLSSEEVTRSSGLSKSSLAPDRSDCKVARVRAIR